MEYIENGKTDLILKPIEVNKLLKILEECREQHKNY